MGKKTSTLAKSTDMKLNDIDPNEADNLGLLDQYNIRLRQLIRALNFILNNHISRKSYNSFNTKKSKFIYIYDCSGRHITCGLILFMMVIQVMNHQLVIDH